MSNPELIVRAHKIALELDGVVSGTDGCTILSMALGIFLEGQQGSHRELIPLAEAINSNAQLVFDQMRLARLRARGGTA